MGENKFTYVVPENFQSQLVRFLQQNGYMDVAQILQRCKIDYEDVGYAYYAGLKGDNWNKNALDLTIEGSENNINLLRSADTELKDAIKKTLKPNISGYLIRNIDYIVSDDNMELVLPEERGESYDILSRDIYNALGNGEPTLVLDRLHTYSTKYLREICQDHNISISDNGGKKYALHSLAGSLAKYYKENKVFKSDFVEQALKMSISTFDKYNDVRNDNSYAHDNDVLNNIEATYVVTVVAATLKLIHEIEIH